MCSKCYMFYSRRPIARCTFFQVEGSEPPVQGAEGQDRPSTKGDSGLASFTFLLVLLIV